DVTGPRARLLAQLPDHLGARTSTLAFAPDGGRLAACAPDGRVRLWDVTARPPRLLDELVHEPGEPPTGGCTAVAFAPDGATLATGGHGVVDAAQPRPSVRLWDVTAVPARPRATLLKQPGQATDLAFDGAGARLFV